MIFRVLVQIAEDGDDVTNATVIWPETRRLVEFGTVTLNERVDELRRSVGRSSSIRSRRWTGSIHRAIR